MSNAWEQNMEKRISELENLVIQLDNSDVEQHKEIAKLRKHCDALNDINGEAIDSNADKINELKKAQQIFIQTISRDFGKIEDENQDRLQEIAELQEYVNAIEKIQFDCKASGGEKEDVLIKEEWIKLRNKNIVFVKREDLEILYEYSSAEGIFEDDFIDKFYAEKKRIKEEYNL